MQRLDVSGAVRPLYGSLGFKRLRIYCVPDFIRVSAEMYEMWGTAC